MLKRKIYIASLLFVCLIAVVLFTGCSKKTKVPAYTGYSIEKLQSELADGKKVVLFFFANWDPYSVTTDTRMQIREKEIPKDVVIMRTDFDNSKLRERYKVENPHLFIYVDKDGNEITRWTARELEALIENVK